MTTAPAPRAGCPVQLTTFIGREREIAAVNDLLQSTRLVTLTGVGGAGKTRLAAEVAAGAGGRARAPADRGSARRLLQAAHLLRPIDRAAAPDAARNHRLEPRAARPGRGRAVSTAVRVRRDLLARCRRGDLSRRRRPRRPVVPRGQVARGDGDGGGRSALSPAGDAAAIRARPAHRRGRSGGSAPATRAVLY